MGEEILPLSEFILAGNVFLPSFAGSLADRVMNDHTATLAPPVPRRMQPRSPLPHAFATQRHGRLLTIGTAFETDARRGFGPLTSATIDLLAYFNAECAEPACATGKMVIADQIERSVRVFQTGRRQSSQVACGNGVAAGAVLLARHRLGQTIPFQVGWENGLLRAEAHVTQVDRLFHVTQRWELGQSWTFDTVMLLGSLRALRVRGLNPYLLVEAPAGFDPRPLLAQALDDDSLAVRAAVITPRRTTPLVRFYSLERAHGGAPQTGLVTLAVAARTVGWMGELLATQNVEHPLGVEPLPTLEFRGDAILCQLPSVLVGLEHLEMEVGQ
jgi:hypothetical protein